MTAKILEFEVPSDLDGDTLELELADVLGHPTEQYEPRPGERARRVKAKANRDGSRTLPLSVSIATQHKRGRDVGQTLLVHLLEDRVDDDAKIAAVVAAHRGAKP